MALIHYQQIVVREEIHECEGRRARSPPGQRSRIVLYPRAEACLSHHFYIKVRSFGYPLCLYEPVLGTEIFDSLLQFLLDLGDASLHLVLRDHIVGCRKDGHMLQLGSQVPREHVELHYTVYLVSEELYSDTGIVGFRREDIQHISVHSEGRTLKIRHGPVVSDPDQLVDHLIPVFLHPGSQGDHHLHIVVGRSQAVDTGYRGHHHHIIPFGKSCGRRQTELVYLIVYR